MGSTGKIMMLMAWSAALAVGGYWMGLRTSIVSRIVVPGKTVRLVSMAASPVDSGVVIFTIMEPNRQLLTLYQADRRNCVENKRLPPNTIQLSLVGVDGQPDTTVYYHGPRDRMIHHVPNTGSPPSAANRVVGLLEVDRINGSVDRWLRRQEERERICFHCGARLDDWPRPDFTFFRPLGWASDDRRQSTPPAEKTTFRTYLY